MLKKIISFILVIVFCSNPLCIAAKELGMKEIAPVSSMSQTEKMNLLKKYISLFDLSGQPKSKEHVDEILDVMNVYFSEYDYHDKASYDLGKEIMHSYVYNYPFDYEVMKNKLKDKTTQIELIQCYAKIPPEDVKVWEEALRLGFFHYSKYPSGYKKFVATYWLLTKNGNFTEEQKDIIFKNPVYDDYKLLVVKKALNDNQVPESKKFDKIIKTFDCMGNRKNDFIISIDEKNSETKLRENFNRLSEIYQEAYNVYDKNSRGDKEVLDFYEFEALKAFFKRFSRASDLPLEEFKAINKLGYTICVYVNKNNFEFIKTVLENPDTEAKKLSDVISLVEFDTEPSEKFKQAFDKGYISSILLSQPTYRDYSGNYRQEKIKLSEVEDHITLADSMEQDQNLNTEQINDILSFNLNVEYKTKIVEKTVEKKSLTPEKKHEIINKKMEKKAKSYTRNSDIKETFEHILIAPFMLVLILIPPIPFAYISYCENVLNDIKTKGFSKPYIIVDTIVLGIGALSPFNLPVLIESLRHRD